MGREGNRHPGRRDRRPGPGNRAAKPSVIFHFGYRGAHHPNEIYLRRSLLILNALMGSIEAKGGIFFKKGPKAAGRGTSASDWTEIPRPSRRPGLTVGTKISHCRPRPRNPQMLPQAILSEDPYPIKALFVYRFEPLMSIPDTHLTKKALENWTSSSPSTSTTAKSPGIRTSSCPNPSTWSGPTASSRPTGLKPQMYLRRQAVLAALRYSARLAVIVKQIGERIGIGKYFPYENSEESGTASWRDLGLTLEDFDKARVRSLHRQAISVGPGGWFEVQDPVKKNRCSSPPAGKCRVSLVPAV